MVLTPSQMLPLGTPAPDFDLPDPDGNRVRLADYAGKPLLVMFICNHCPYVKHMKTELGAFSAEYAEKGLASVGINSNDVENYPEDSPAKMKEDAERFGYAFAYLFDEDQSVAKAYSAACTPDFFLFDADHRLVYRGQFDDSRPNSGVPVTGEDLRVAVDDLLAGGAPSTDQTASIGCNIKWKPGNEPDYFG
jgi:peroxiredoxin